MTDELHKLIAELRHPIQRNERYYEPLCARAADELERLVALAQSPPRPDASAGLTEAAENVVIAFGIGWDMEGVIERLIETLPQESVCRSLAAVRSGK